MEGYTLYPTPRVKLQLDVDQSTLNFRNKDPYVTFSGMVRFWSFVIVLVRKCANLIFPV